MTNLRLVFICDRCAVREERDVSTHGDYSYTMDHASSELPRGWRYVGAFKMCPACNKSFNEWLVAVSLERTAKSRRGK